MRNFYQFHKRLPDADSLPLAADHLFFSKFFRVFPTEPNAASKLNAEQFLDRERFGDRIYVPRREFIATNPQLPEDLSPMLGWWLKLDLGNAMHVRLEQAHIAAERQSLQNMVRNWFRQPGYGWRWGEWWYSVSPQRVFFEEDLADRMPGEEYQFFMKRGVCVMYKKKRILRSGDLMEKRNVAAFFDGDGNHVPGLQNSYSGPVDQGLSPHFDVMFEAATQIASAFDYVRVDFIDLYDAPALGELTYCPMNARIRYSTDALEALAREAVRQIHSCKAASIRLAPTLGVLLCSVTARCHAAGIGVFRLSGLLRQATTHPCPIFWRLLRELGLYLSQMFMVLLLSVSFLGWCSDRGAFKSWTESCPRRALCDQHVANRCP